MPITKRFQDSRGINSFPKKKRVPPVEPTSESRWWSFSFLTKLNKKIIGLFQSK